MLHLLSDFASSAKYLEVKQQHKIEKDGQLQTDGKCIILLHTVKHVYFASIKFS